MYGRLVVARAASDGVEQLLEAQPHRGGSPFGILGTHVCVAHQHDGVLGSLPGTDFQAARVVVVVGALALRHVPPGSSHVPGGENVLQEVKRKRFIGEHGECEGGALFGRQVLAREPRCLLQRAQVIPAPHADGVDLGSGLEGVLHVVRGGEIHLGTGQQEMRIVGSGARRVLRVGALQSYVGIAKRVEALRLAPLRSPPAGAGRRSVLPCAGATGAIFETRIRSILSCAPTSATSRIHSELLIESSICLLEHE